MKSMVKREDQKRRVLWVKTNNSNFWSRMKQITQCHQHHYLCRNPLQPLSFPKKLADSPEHPAKKQKTQPTIQRKRCKKLSFQQPEVWTEAIICWKKIFTCWQRELLLSVGTCTVNTLVSSTASQANPYTFIFIKLTSCFQANRNDFLALLTASAFNF